MSLSVRVSLCTCHEFQIPELFDQGLGVIDGDEPLQHNRLDLVWLQVAEVTLLVVAL